MSRRQLSAPTWLSRDALGLALVAGKVGLEVKARHPRLLQQNATTRDSAQVSHVTSTKPNLASPQVRKRSTFSITRVGIEPYTSGLPRRKASGSTDFPGARRRPTSPVYCSPFSVITRRQLLRPAIAPSDVGPTR